MKRRTLVSLLAATMTLSAGAAFAASDFPTRPVTMIVPYTAGGPSDVAFRILGEELQKVWGQRVIIDNKPGGGTVIGTQALARAVPDGYTMGFAGGSFVVNPGTRKSLPYDALKDFRGIAVVADAPLDIVSSTGFQANTLQELIALAKTRELTYATAGPGSVAHMSGELLARVTGMRMEHVPYAGDAAAFPDVASGRVNFRVGSWSDDRPHVEAGRLKLLGIFYPRRIADAPNAPTVAEVVPEMAQYPAGVFNSVVVPAGVPQEVLDRIGEHFRQALASDSFKQRISALGLYPRYTTPAETDAFLRRQIETWTRIAREANLQFD